MARQTQKLCPCGRPLHYPNAKTQAYVLKQIEQLGPTINVSTAKGVFAVPRHYVALHGLRARDIAKVAAAYGFTRLDGGDPH
jgi:hypothetical protein